MLTLSEENHLKAIYHLSNHGKEAVSTNALADALRIKPASVTDMLKKLAQKQLIEHEKYQGVKLSLSGRTMALNIVRKHRLWEVFLVEKLKFNWVQVHEIAEQLEHIQSPLLIQRLDEFLGFPQVDPHGDPIPDANGDYATVYGHNLCAFQAPDTVTVTGVKNSSTEFLQYLDKWPIHLGTKLKIVEKIAFDGSMQVLLENQTLIMLTQTTAENLLVCKLE